MVKLTKNYLKSIKKGNKYLLNRLIGTTVNTMTVTRVYRDYRHHIHLILRCECGHVNEIRLHTLLKYLDTYYCNEPNHRAKIKYSHLIGTKVDGYEILDILGVRQDSVLYKLKCDCGTILELSKDELKRVKLQCECKYRDYDYYYDISTEIGKEFGDLLVVNIYRDFVKDSNIIFCDVKCRCGSYSKGVRLNSLKRGRTKSCGCVLREKYNCNTLIGKEVDGFLVKDFYRKGLEGYFFLVEDKRGIQSEIYSADLLKGRLPSYWHDTKSSKKVRVGKFIYRKYSAKKDTTHYFVTAMIDGNNVYRNFDSFSDAYAFVKSIEK